MILALLGSLVILLLLIWLTTGHSTFYWLLRLLIHAEACQHSLSLACRAFYHEYRRSYPISLRRVRRTVSRPHQPRPLPAPPAPPARERSLDNLLSQLVSMIKDAWQGVWHGKAN